MDHEMFLEKMIQAGLLSEKETQLYAYILQGQRITQQVARRISLTKTFTDDVTPYKGRYTKNARQELYEKRASGEFIHRQMKALTSCSEAILIASMLLSRVLVPACQ